MTQDGPAAPRASTVRRLAARLVLLGGVGLALGWLSQFVPRDQELVFRIPDAGSVRRFDLSLTRDGDRTPDSGVTLRYPGAPLGAIRHRASLPNGRYVLAISVTRELSDGPKETSWVRRVSLEGGETLVVLEGSP